LFNISRCIFLRMNLEREILELLMREGPVTVYRIAKAFGITYGRAQWHIGRPQRRGHVYTVRIGSKRYVALRGADVLQKVTVRDVLDEITHVLSTRGIRPEMPLREALEALEAKAPHLAEALRLIAQVK
jgi:DNA-binding transcriptional ArsR family regulator